MLSVLQGFPFPAPLTRERLSWGPCLASGCFWGAVSPASRPGYGSKRKPGDWPLWCSWGPRLVAVLLSSLPDPPRVCSIWCPGSEMHQFLGEKYVFSTLLWIYRVLLCVLRAWVIFWFSFLPPPLPPSTYYPPTPNWVSRCSWKIRGFPGDSGGRICLQCRRPGFIPWRRKWQPTPVLWPGEFHGQGNLAEVHGVTKSRTWLSYWHLKNWRFWQYWTWKSQYPSLSPFLPRC